MLRNYVAALLGGHRTLEFCFNSAELIEMARMHIKIIFIKCRNLYNKPEYFVFKHGM